MIPCRLIHYGREPLTVCHDVEQSEFNDNFKPAGLWVSAEGDDDWPAWCAAENFALDRLINPIEVVLAPNARLLHLSCEDELDDFTAVYSVLAVGSLHTIDWPRVASNWDGIVIAPYVWSRRLTRHTFWYYGWDCSSGCIWNASSVAELRPLAGDKP